MSVWNDFAVGVALVVTMGLMFGFGWLAAHDEVSTECERQGSFYVGDTTYTCAPEKPE